jgi:ketosteroid isomerase-like protein
MRQTSTTSDNRVILEWFRTWEAAINARDFESARALFDNAVVGFGTTVEVAHGLDELEHEQWRKTWPRIERFRFNFEEMKVLLEEEGESATVLSTWSSLGIREDGGRFERPGRTTVVLKRNAMGSWKAIHTHFSLKPDPK